MTGREFIARTKRIARHNGVEVTIDTARGKGSHIVLYYGSRRTTIQDLKRDIPPGTLNAMIRQIGLRKKDYQ